MSNIQWITINKRLQQGISLINTLNNKKFELLLVHIINSTSDDIFTEIELQKLQETLKLTEPQLQLLLQSIAYIYKQSGKVIIKPTELQRQLQEVLNFEVDKADIFVKEWTTQTQDELGDFEQRDILKGVNWEINLQTASDKGSKQMVPNARIELGLAKINNENEKQTAILELGEADLQQLYNTLEVIQLKLDNFEKK